MKTLLYATDCTPTTSAALKYAHRLSRVLNAKLHVLHIYDLQPFTTANVRSRGILEKNYFLDQLEVLQRYCKNQLKNELGALDAEFHVVKSTNISKAILKTAQEIKADLVMVGVKSTKSLRGFFTGNIAENLMDKLKSPLLILPDDYHLHDISTVLYATDFEPTDVFALKRVTNLVESYGALIKVFHIPLKTEVNVDEKMEIFKEEVLKRIDYPEIIFSIEYADDVESGIHNSIKEEIPEMLVMMEREQPSFFDRLFCKDTVETIEGKISIPLLVFNKKSIVDMYAQDSNDALKEQIIS
ncbi:MAG: universal stress protein [Bacteroidota bacterium]